MVLTHSTEHVYPYQWDLVTRAFWNKYPNPKLEHVQRMDVLNQYIDEQGCLHTARLARCTQRNVPSWVESVLGKFAYVYEESICDPKNKTLLLKSSNLSFSSVATVQETCLYKSHLQNPNWTEYIQESKVTAFIPLLSRKLEDFSVTCGAITAAKGLRAMETICNDIFEGTFTPVLCEADMDSSTSESMGLS